MALTLFCSSLGSGPSKCDTSNGAVLTVLKIEAGRQSSWARHPSVEIAGWKWLQTQLRLQLPGPLEWRSVSPATASIFDLSEIVLPRPKPPSSLPAKRRWPICELTLLCQDTSSVKSARNLEPCCRWILSLLEAWEGIVHPNEPWVYKVPLEKFVWPSDVWSWRSWC